MIPSSVKLEQIHSTRLGLIKSTLHYKLFAATFQLHFAIRIGQIQKSDGILGHQIDFITIKVAEKSFVDGVAELVDFDFRPFIFLPTVLE